MTFRRKLYLFLGPSLLSFTCCAIISLIFIGTACFILAQHNGTLGTFTPWTYLQGNNISNSLSLLRTSLNNAHLTSIFFIVFWILLGFIAYNVVFALKGSVDESVGFMTQMRYVNAHPVSMGTHAIIRYIFIIFALALWILYALIFSWNILPILLNLIDKTLSKNGSPLYIGLSILISLVTSHLAVILLRITFMRARITNRVK